MGLVQCEDARRGMQAGQPLGSGRRRRRRDEPLDLRPHRGEDGVLAVEIGAELVERGIDAWLEAEDERPTALSVLLDWLEGRRS